MVSAIIGGILAIVIVGGVLWACLDVYAREQERAEREWRQIVQRDQEARKAQAERGTMRALTTDGDTPLEGYLREQEAEERTQEALEEITEVAP
jgi:porphobilinogen deaminase